MSPLRMVPRIRCSGARGPRFTVYRKISPLIYTALAGGGCAERVTNRPRPTWRVFREDYRGPRGVLAGGETRVGDGSTSGTAGRLIITARGMRGSRANVPGNRISLSPVDKIARPLINFLFETMARILQNYKFLIYRM